MRKNLLIIFTALLFGLFPLLWTSIGGGIQGTLQDTDMQTIEAIREIAPGYQPWLAPLWDPAAHGIEPLIFSLQAALGAGFIAYYLLISRKKKKETS